MSHQPTLEEREIQLQTIREEVSRDPLLSEPEKLSKTCKLIVELENDSMYKEQALSLFGASEASTKQYAFTHIRYSRRDGNCFFRCAAFEMLSLLLRYPEQANLHLALLLSYRERLLQRFDSYVSDFSDVVESIVRGIAEGTLCTLQELSTRFNSEDGSYIIVYYRYAISAYLQDHADEYMPYVEGLNYSSIGAYCSAEVEPVDHDSDNIQVAAFAAHYNLMLRICSLDRNTGTNITEHTFNDATGNDVGVTVNLLYRPGHYDLLEMD